MIQYIAIIITELANVLKCTLQFINKYISDSKTYYRNRSYILKINKDKTFIGYQKQRNSLFSQGGIRYENVKNHKWQKTLLYI